jgi:hypothetical protein
MPPSIEERVAVLESRMDHDDEDRAERRKELDAQLEAIRAALEANAREMARYKGFIGAIVLTVSGIAWLVGTFKDHFFAWLAK